MEINKLLTMMYQAYIDSPIIGSYAEIKPVFEKALESLSEKHNTLFTTENRKIRVVPVEEMREDCGMGNALAYRDKKKLCFYPSSELNVMESFDIMLGAAKRPHLLTCLAHEYGHTLEPHYDPNSDLIREEMKAFAFQKILKEEIIGIAALLGVEMVGMDNIDGVLGNSHPEGAHRKAHFMCE